MSLHPAYSQAPMPTLSIGIIYWTSFGASRFHVSLGDIGPLAQSVVGGLIGGVTVFLGVLLAERLTRRRELEHRFDDAFWELYLHGRELADQIRRRPAWR